MKRNQRTRLESLLSMAALAVLALALCAGPAAATNPTTVYLSDGSSQNPLGGWSLPTLHLGTCAATGSQLSRPDCLALRFNYATSALCTGASANYAFTSVCNDKVNTTQATCTGPGRVWIDFGGGNGKCAINLKGYDRNATQCTLLGGVYESDCTGKWTAPPVVNGFNNGSTSPGDQCLRCHNSEGQYNGPRARDVESYLDHGHKNIIRPVQPPTPIYGPGASTPYTFDASGNTLNWNNGTTKVGGVDYSLVFFLNQWMAPLGTTYYKAPAVNGKPAFSYSCARCHTTNWTSDATLQSQKEPEKSFPGITWDGVSAADNKINLAGGLSGDTNKMASWDQYGITCTRCHGSAWDTATSASPADPNKQSSHNNGMTGFNAAICSKPDFTDPASCTNNGGTWLSTLNSGVATCSVAGLCQINGVLHPEITAAGSCTGTGAIWTATSTSDDVACGDIRNYGKANNVPAYAAATYSGLQPKRGQIITSLCLNCHRNDSGGVPVEPDSGIQVGNNHSAGLVTFIGHAVGQEYLNSPHAKFNGAFNTVATAPFTYTPNGAGFKSFFMSDGEAKGTGNGCTGCHDIHNSTVTNEENAFKAECTECHTKTQATTHHPTGQGTPFQGTLFQACTTCHMPNGAHLFRINTDVNYTLFPASALTANQTAATAPDGNYNNAVWVDLDQACGQCHGGGNGQATTTIASNSGAALTVGSTTGFYVGGKVRIKGAGVLQTDSSRGDFIAQVKTIGSGTITLAGTPALANVAGKSLEQNFTINGAAYYTKAELAPLAVGMHEDAPDVRFTVTPAALKVTVDGSATTCQGSAANCNVYTWDFGDNTATGSGVTTTHTYAAAGTYTITLTVEQYSAGTGSVSRTITVNGPGPTAGGSCTFFPNTWVASVTDGSTPGTGGTALRSVAVFWGDGSTIALDTVPPFGKTYTHTYLIPSAAPAGYQVKIKATDTRGRNSTATLTCSPAVAPAYFAINGSVVDNAVPANPIGIARVQLFKGTKLFRAIYTAADGTFVLGQLPPGSYTVVVTKTGYTFPGPIAVGVGPSGPVGPIVGVPGP